MALSFKEVAEILKLIDASDCDEVMLEVEGTKLMIRRNAEGSAMPMPVQSQPVTAAAPHAVPAPAAERPAASPAPAQAEEPQVDGNLVALRAPMVGTFYRRPSPDEDAFVEVGSPVKAGDPLCLIEVMKLYTTIEAPEDGTIERIAVEDGTLVEFNALLFLIRPAADDGSAV